MLSNSENTLILAHFSNSPWTATELTTRHGYLISGYAPIGIVARIAVYAKPLFLLSNQLMRDLEGPFRFAAAFFRSRALKDGKDRILRITGISKRSLAQIKGRPPI